MPPRRGEDKENAFTLHDSHQVRHDHQLDRQALAYKSLPHPNVKGLAEPEAKWIQGKSAFECRITFAASETELPVQFWCDYTTWAAEWKAEGADYEREAKAILKRACVFLLATSDQEIKNDVRYLRLWIRHANNVAEPEKVFEDLESQGVGLGHALLYEAWAAICEKRHCYEAAEDIYQRGLRQEAKPLDRLQTRHADFQGRQKRRARRMQPASKPKPAETQEEIARPAVVAPAPSHEEGAIPAHVREVLSFAEVALGLKLEVGTLWNTLQSLAWMSFDRFENLILTHTHISEQLLGLSLTAIPAGVLMDVLAWIGPQGVVPCVAVANSWRHEVGSAGAVVFARMRWGRRLLCNSQCCRERAKHATWKKLLDFDRNMQRALAELEETAPLIFPRLSAAPPPPGSPTRGFPPLGRSGGSPCPQQALQTLLRR